MRRGRYRVAVSLDGYLAGPNGEIDWITPDPSVDFASIYSEFDTVLLGRRTYERTRKPGAPPWPGGWRIYVLSKTLDPSDHPAVTVVGTDVGETVADLRAESGRDIWLFGGGSLFATLLAAGQVDRAEVAVMPVLLGQGIPLLGGGAPGAPLSLVQSDRSKAGIMNLVYDIRPASG